MDRKLPWGRYVLFWDRPSHLWCVYDRARREVIARNWQRWFAENIVINENGRSRGWVPSFPKR